MSTPTRRPSPAKKAAPAAGLLTDKPTPKIIQAAPAAPSPAAGQPLAQATPDEHAAAQRAYRELRERIASETTAAAEAKATEPAAAVPGLSRAERAARAAQESLGAYLAALIEMAPDEPRYVVGLRPPRPKVFGLRLEVGDVVPGAHSWPRLETWLRTGVLTSAPTTKAG